MKWHQNLLNCTTQSISMTKSWLLNAVAAILENVAILKRRMAWTYLFYGDTWRVLVARLVSPFDRFYQNIALFCSTIAFPVRTSGHGNMMWNLNGLVSDILYICLFKYVSTFVRLCMSMSSRPRRQHFKVSTFLATGYHLSSSIISSFHDHWSISSFVL